MNTLHFYFQNLYDPLRSVNHQYACFSLPNKSVLIRLTCRFIHNAPKLLREEYRTGAGRGINAAVEKQGRMEGNSMKLSKISGFDVFYALMEL